MPCMLIYGVSGTGKTMLLEKFQRDHLKTCEERSGRRTIVSAELPPVPLLRSLYAEIIRSLSADVSPTMRLHELETRAIGMLQHAAPRMLLIDEIQHLLSCGLRDQRAALNAIKFLANKLRVSIVAAGTHEALHAMRSYPPIASRFEQLELPVWTESQELRRFIAGYLALLPIKKTAAAIDKDLWNICSNYPKASPAVSLMSSAARRCKESRTRLRKSASFSCKSSERKCRLSWANAPRFFL